MKKISKILLISAAMILTSCGSGDNPTESNPAVSADSTSVSASDSESDTGKTPESSSSQGVPSTPAPVSSSKEETPSVASTSSKIEESATSQTPSESSQVEDSEPVVIPDGQGTITLADGASTLSDNADGVVVNNTLNEIHITKKGSYTIEGTLTDGSIIVDESVGSDAVEINLNDVSIARTGNNTSAPIVGRHSGKLKVKKGKNKIQTITDNRTLKKASDGAAIFANGYLDIPGKGTMTITATGNGIESGTYIEAKNGTLNITSAKKGAYARRSILLGEEGGAFNITSTGSHGIEVEAKADATFEEGELKGVCIVDGTVNIHGSKKGINSDYTVDIQGAKGTIESDTDRSINAKADLKMSGGEITYKATVDNAIKSDLGITISGGKHTMESDVKGLVCLKDINITGGGVFVTKATDGIEANNITVSGDTTIVEIKASANGINAIADLTPEEDEGLPTIKIDAGNVYVESTGDGLDSNGDIVINGGNTIINQNGAGNSAIDYGYDQPSPGTFKQNGGLLVAYGANEGIPQNTGTQRSVIVASTGCTTGNFFKVANGQATYYVQPQVGTAEQLYISAADFTDGAVTVSQLASATPGTLIFKGVYTSAAEEGEATTLGAGTFAANALHLNLIPASGE